MRVRNSLNDMSTNNKILGLINAALFTAILTQLFELGTTIGVSVFFIITIIVWVVSALNNRKYKVINNGT